MLPSSYRLLLLTTLSTLALGACGSSDTIPKPKSDAPMPPIAEMDAAMAPSAAAVAIGAPAGLAPSDTLTPLAASPEVFAPSPSVPPVETGSLTAEERLARLENSVMALQSEYQRMAPAFASLNTTNQRIQALLDELETSPKTKTASSEAASSVPMLVQPSPVSAPVPKAVEKPATTPAVAAAVQPQPPAAKAAMPMPQGDWAVKAVRIGEHGNKTRLVLDLTGTKKPPFTYDLDNTEKLLLVELPARWTGKEAGTPRSPMIAGWKAQASAQGGTVLAIQLLKNARVQSTQFLGPEGKDPARLVMDIAPTN